MAVCIIFIVGRIGSIISSNVVGHLLETNCILTFNLFGGAALGMNIKFSFRIISNFYNFSLCCSITTVAVQKQSLKLVG